MNVHLWISHYRDEKTERGGREMLTAVPQDHRSLIAVLMSAQL